MLFFCLYKGRYYNRIMKILINKMIHDNVLGFVFGLDFLFFYRFINGYHEQYKSFIILLHGMLFVSQPFTYIGNALRLVPTV